MASFKVFAALLVVCVAQNVVNAGTLPRDYTFYEVDKHDTDKHDVALVEHHNLFGNPFQCMGQLGELYNVVQEIRGLVQGYREVRNKYVQQKEQCNSLPTEAERAACNKDADEKMEKDTEDLIVKVKGLAPRIVDLLQNFKKCLFD